MMSVRVADLNEKKKTKEDSRKIIGLKCHPTKINSKYLINVIIVSFDRL
jgi:hypothetical protein